MKKFLMWLMVIAICACASSPQPTQVNYERLEAYTQGYHSEYGRFEVDELSDSVEGRRVILRGPDRAKRSFSGVLEILPKLPAVILPGGIWQYSQHSISYELAGLPLSIREFELACDFWIGGRCEFVSVYGQYTKNAQIRTEFQGFLYFDELKWEWAFLKFTTVGKDCPDCERLWVDKMIGAHSWARQEIYSLNFHYLSPTDIEKIVVLEFNPTADPPFSFLRYLSDEQTQALAEK